MYKILVILISLIALTLTKSNSTQVSIHIDEKDDVVELINKFGNQLKKVSLQAPEQMLKENIKENYNIYVTKNLINKWLNDPSKAPGRMTSSPWPEYIEIYNISRENDNYIVYGYIVEITSFEKVKGGYANKIPIELKLIKVNNNWKINDIQIISNFH